MAIDKNPRHWFLDVDNIEANVDASTQQDFITIEVHGMITPTLKDRLNKALLAGEFEIVVKKFG